MTLPTFLEIVAVALLLALSFFLTAAESAVSAVSRTRLAGVEKTGGRRAAMLSRLIEKRERLVGAVLVGGTLARAAAACIATGLFVSRFGAIGVLYAVPVCGVAILLVTDVLPRTLAILAPDREALALAMPLRLAVRILAPLATLSRWVVGAGLRPFGIRIGEKTPFAPGAEDLRGSGDHLEGSVEKTDRDMMDGLLDLKELCVGDVMVHRTKVFALDITEPAGTLVQSILAAPYTRVPLWRETPDNIVGLVHVKDLLRALDGVGNDPGRLDLDEIARPAWFVPDTTSLVDQLKSFRRRKMHFAVVVDEYGEMLGIVTLEDIIEEIVGDISDEHDVVVSGVRPQADGTVNVDGSVPIRDLNRALDWSLPDEEATTIAGLVIHEARLIPEAGQTFTFHGFRIQVLRKQRNRITALRMTPLDKPGHDARHV